MPQAPENLREFASLVKVVEALRGPDGCPWDKEQTHESLTQYAIEEAHELAEAMDQGETSQIVEELGDVLLQVVLNAEIGRQAGTFDIYDVIHSISEKMVRRHPHVFADIQASNSDEATESFNSVKEAEKAKTQSEFIQFQIPLHLPALLRSQKIGGKTKKYKFDWESPEQVFEKVEEELKETKEAHQNKSKTEQQGEIGDLLFSVAQLARHLDIDAEQALRQCNSRFESRWLRMQELAKDKSQTFTKLSQDELEELWQEAKNSLSKD